MGKNQEKHNILIRGELEILLEPLEDVVYHVFDLVVSGTDIALLM